LQGNVVSQACGSATRIPCYTAAADAMPKSDQKRNMSEVKQGFREACLAPAPRCPLASGYAPCKGSEFVSFADFGAAAAGSRRPAACGRVSLLIFFGETKKMSSRRATPGKAPRSGGRIVERKTTLDSRLKHAGTTVERIARKTSLTGMQAETTS
jgi:hypothetical protein